MDTTCSQSSRLQGTSPQVRKAPWALQGDKESTGSKVGRVCAVGVQSVRRPGERQLLRRGQRRLTGAMLGGGPPGRDDLTLAPLGGSC